jgi:hypothetical protein
VTEKPSQSEEEYFVRENAETLRRMAAEQQARLDAEGREQRRLAHWMRCPKCGAELKTVRFRGLGIDRCFSCNGTWLDAGELEKLAADEPALMRAVLRVFEHRRSL